MRLIKDLKDQYLVLLLLVVYINDLLDKTINEPNLYRQYSKNNNINNYYYPKKSGH